jgi:hypothetical protein
VTTLVLHGSAALTFHHHSCTPPALLLSHRDTIALPMAGPVGTHRPRQELRPRGVVRRLCVHSLAIASYHIETHRRQHPSHDIARHGKISRKHRNPSEDIARHRTTASHRGRCSRHAGVAHTLM